MYSWQQNVDCYFRQNPKFVYYLSAEYLLGPAVGKKPALYRIPIRTGAQDTMQKHDIRYRPGRPHCQLDIEPGLGNGGLGRLSACFMDSLATLEHSRQSAMASVTSMAFSARAFRDGWQIESPDEWLYYGNPWEFPQPDDMVEVGFGAMD